MKHTIHPSMSTKDVDIHQVAKALLHNDEELRVSYEQGNPNIDYSHTQNNVEGVDIIDNYPNGLSRSDMEKYITDTLTEYFDERYEDSLNQYLESLKSPRRSKVKTVIDGLENANRTSGNNLKDKAERERAGRRIFKELVISLRPADEYRMDGQDVLDRPDMDGDLFVKDGEVLVEVMNDLLNIFPSCDFIHTSVHMDEYYPHIHAVYLPVVAKSENQMNASSRTSFPLTPSKQRYIYESAKRFDNTLPVEYSSLYMNNNHEVVYDLVFGVDGAIAESIKQGFRKVYPSDVLSIERYEDESASTRDVRTLRNAHMRIEAPLRQARKRVSELEDELDRTKDKVLSYINASMSVYQENIEAMMVLETIKHLMFDEPIQTVEEILDEAYDTSSGDGGDVLDLDGILKSVLGDTEADAQSFKL